MLRSGPGFPRQPRRCWAGRIRRAAADDAEMATAKMYRTPFATMRNVAGSAGSAVHAGGHNEPLSASPSRRECHSRAVRRRRDRTAVVAVSGATRCQPQRASPHPGTRRRTTPMTQTRRTVIDAGARSAALVAPLMRRTALMRVGSLPNK
jgi:hypothetical protein